MFVRLIVTCDVSIGALGIGFQGFDAEIIVWGLLAGGFDQSFVVGVDHSDSAAIAGCYCEDFGDNEDDYQSL